MTIITNVAIYIEHINDD